MENEMDAEKNRFREFLKKLSAQYQGNQYRLLKFLLYDHLPISLLASTDVVGLDLFNQLHIQGDISYTDVNILSEIAKVTKRHVARTIISQYRQEPTSNAEGLTQYRKDLFKAMRDVTPEDLKQLRAFYQLGDHDFENIWDLVFYLEKQELLEDTEVKRKQFADNLNARAKRTFLANLTKPTEGGGSSTSSPATTANVDRPSTEQDEASSSKGMSPTKFNAMLITVSTWYEDGNYTNMLKLLYNDLIETESSKTTKDLFDSLGQAAKLKHSNLKVLIDTITITNTRGVIDVNESLSDANKDDKVTSFSSYRQQLIELGNVLSPGDTRKVADLYRVPKKDYTDQWTLITILEKKGVINSEDKKSFIEDLKTIDLHHAAKKLEKTTTRKRSHNPDNDKTSNKKQKN